MDRVGPWHSIRFKSTQLIFHVFGQDGRALHHMLIQDFQYKASLRMETEARVAEANAARARAEVSKPEPRSLIT